MKLSRASRVTLEEVSQLAEGCLVFLGEETVFANVLATTLTRGS